MKAIIQFTIFIFIFSSSLTFLCKPNYSLFEMVKPNFL